MLTVRIGPIDGRADLHLNYECEPGGWIDASLIPEAADRTNIVTATFNFIL